MTEAALFAEVDGLMMHSDVHRVWDGGSRYRLVLPPIMLGQYFDFRDDDDDLTGFFTWANLTEEAETGYLERTRKLQPDDWNAGDGSRIWMIDVLAPFGGLRAMIREVHYQMRTLATLQKWTVKDFRWARSFGSGKVRRIGKAAR